MGTNGEGEGERERAGQLSRGTESQSLLVILVKIEAPLEVAFSI